MQVTTANKANLAYAVEGPVTYNATYWDDIRVALTSTKLAGVKDPGFAAYAGTGVYTYHFDASTEEEIFFVTQVPHGYKLGTTINVHVHYAADTTSTGNLVMGLQYMIISANQIVSTATTITSSVTIATAAQYKQSYLDFTQSIAAQYAVSSVIVGRLYRDATASTDTLAGDVTVFELDFHYQQDSPGSRGIITK